MRGVKIDPKLMSSVISDGINNGCVSMEDVILHTKDKIKKMDQKIIDVERLKVIRSKLSAIVSSLEDNIHNEKDEKILSLFEIKDISKGEVLCKKMSQIMLDNGENFVIDPIKYIVIDNVSEKFDWIYCLKDLCKHKVLINDCGKIYKGENFLNFLVFVVNSNG